MGDVEKISYFCVNRKLSAQEWEELKNWRVQNPKLSWKRGNVNANNLFFISYSKYCKNGERWVAEEKYNETVKSIKSRSAENKLIETTPQQKSLFNLGRKLTDLEWEELTIWKKNNPEAKWKRGNIDPRNPRKIFKTYAKGCINGESWGIFQTSENSLSRRRDREHKKRETPLETRKKSYFNHNRMLTDDEWNELRKWRTLNKECVWDHNEENPFFEDLFFDRYSRSCSNGEKWVTKESLVHQSSHSSKYLKEKRTTDHLFKFQDVIRNSIGRTFKVKKERKPCKTYDILGCSKTEFINHIQSKMTSQMNWRNFGGKSEDLVIGETWDVDHIIPIRLAKTKEEIIILNNYLNLRPFCSYENRFIKRASLPTQDQVDQIVLEIEVIENTRQLNQREFEFKKYLTNFIKNEHYNPRGRY